MKRILLFFSLLAFVCIVAIGSGVSSNAILSKGGSLDYKETYKAYHWPMTNKDKGKFGLTALNSYRIDEYMLSYHHAHIEGIATRGEISCAEPGRGLISELYTVTTTGPHIALFSEYIKEPLWVDDQYSISSTWSTTESNTFYFARLKTNNVPPPMAWYDKNTNKLTNDLEGHLLIRGDVRPVYESSGIYKATIEITEKEGYLNTASNVNVYIVKILDENMIPDGVSGTGKALILKRLSKNPRMSSHFQGEEIGVYTYNLETKKLEQFVAPDGRKDIVKLAAGYANKVVAYSTAKQTFIYQEGKYNPLVIDTGTPESLTVTWDNKAVILTLLNVYKSELPTFYWMGTIIDIKREESEPFITTWFPMKDISAVPGSNMVLFVWQN